jgi:hypothetical protein
VHHTAARFAIARILTGSGFARSAVEAVLLARLPDDQNCPEPLRVKLAGFDGQREADAAPPYTSPLNQQPVPELATDMCVQVMPALLANPADPGQALASLWALAELWPHVAGDERAVLRSQLLNSLAARRCDPEAALTVFQLREWQKKVPTQYGAASPNAASLGGILRANEPLQAYLLLAEHLGMAVDLETLCWVVGTLSVQLGLTHHDRSGLIADLLAGAAALERLVPLVPAELLVTAISQLVHRMWWLSARHRLHAIRQSIDATQRPLRPAIETGDITQAQRAARTLAGQRPDGGAAELWLAVDELLPLPARGLGRVLRLMDAARWRAEDGRIATDDAALIAGSLADLRWQRARS